MCQVFLLHLRIYFSFSFRRNLKIDNYNIKTSCCLIGYIDWNNVVFIVYFLFFRFKNVPYTHDFYSTVWKGTKPRIITSKTRRVSTYATPADIGGRVQKVETVEPLKTETARDVHDEVLNFKTLSITRIESILRASDY